MRALLVALMVTGPAWSEPLVDLPTLFAQHADKVVVKDNGGIVYREVMVHDGVVTRCKGEGYDDCTSIDFSNRGDTTDCALVYALRTLILAQRCEIGGAASRFMLEKVMNQLGEHVARNAVPPRDWTALQDLVQKRALDEPLATCEQIDAVGRDFLEVRLSLKNLRELQDMTATPRLPVGKCLD